MPASWSMVATSAGVAGSARNGHGRQNALIFDHRPSILSALPNRIKSRCSGVSWAPRTLQLHAVERPGASEPKSTRSAPS